MDVVLKLPEELVKQAQAAGILTDEQVANLLQTELERRQRKQALFADIENLRHQQPALAPSEIEAEIKAFRQTRSANRPK
jgi:3-hydroxymyristoyl/3-hydroxydecanoyl-(acyl carrier protein) dehydratase